MFILFNLGLCVIKINTHINEMQNKNHCFVTDVQSSRNESRFGIPEHKQH